jgi:hypothetical protein
MLAARWQQVDPERLWEAGWSCPSGAIRLMPDQGTIGPRWDEAAHWDGSRHPAAAHQRDEPQNKWQPGGGEAARHILLTSRGRGVYW